jgi:DNA-binding response OmpR family regulator
VKILLVDDEKSIRITLGDALEEAGHEVLRAGTAAQPWAWSRPSTSTA